MTNDPIDYDHFLIKKSGGATTHLRHCFESGDAAAPATLLRRLLVQQIGEINVPFYDTSIKLGTLILDTLRNIKTIGSNLGTIRMSCLKKIG
jgi:hypothetical protein